MSDNDVPRRWFSIDCDGILNLHIAAARAGVEHLRAKADRHRAEVAAARAEGRAAGLAEAEAAVRLRAGLYRVCAECCDTKAPTTFGTFAGECDATADWIAGLPR